MNRREFLKAASVPSCFTLAGCNTSTESSPPETTTKETTRTSTPTVTASPTPTKYSNPVFEPTFADPTSIRTDDGTFYAYATEDNWHDGKGFRDIPVIRSEDLVDWEYVGEAFENPPDWKGGHLWAPDINYINGQYVLYYSLSRWGDRNPGIGVATADSAAGPFKDQGELIRSKEIGVPNSIDPFYYEEDSTKYLFWGSFHGIYGITLSDDGLALEGEKFQIVGDRFEGAYIMKRDDTYYFFGSSGSCCDGPLTTYQVEVGRADSLRGPYVNADGRDLMTAPGEIVVTEGKYFAGPGHNTMAIDDAGQRWLLYHAYDKDDYWIQDTPRRPLCIDPVVWTDGWPHVPGKSPRRSGTVPVIET